MSRYFETLQQLGELPELMALDPVPPGRRRPRLTSVRSSPSEEPDWLRALETLRRQWRVASLFAISVMATVLLVTLLTKPIYAPVARVEIDPPGAELFNLDGREGAESSPEYLETQARNMRSPELLLSVIRQLQLDQMQEFKNQSLVSRLVNGALSTVESAPTLIWGRKRVGGAPLPLPDGLERLSPTEASTLGAVQSQLSIDRDTASHLVNVSFKSHDPILSAQVTNTLVHAFIDRTYQTKHDAVMQSTEWLSRQLDDIRSKMDESNRELAEFAGKSGIADVDQNRNTFSEQMAELGRQKTQAQAERVQFESYLNKTNDEDLANLPQVQNNLVIQQLSQKLAEARADLAQTLAIYGKNHPNSKKLQNQIDELEAQVRLQRNAILGQMETSYAAARMREQMLDAQMRGTSRQLSQMAQYTALKKDAQVNADLYNALYARIKEAGITAASKSSNIRIVDQATVLTSPTSPKPLMNLGIGLVVALIGGILLTLGREAFDTRVHTAADVLRSTSISGISLIPATTLPSPMFAPLSEVFGLAKGKEVDVPAKFLLDQPNSEQSEAIRGLRTSVLLSNPGRPPHSILVASSVPAEGKTTVAINLAIALAQQGSVCILDADLRRSSVARAFHLDGLNGLASYLEKGASLASVLAPAPGVPSLSIITSGGPVSEPGKLVASEAMRDLLRTLRSRFEYVVVDAPPILPYADGRALAPFVDGVVFVTRAGVVTRDAMVRSLELLEGVHSAPVLEIVLNGADTNSRSYGYGYGYGYSQNGEHRQA